MKHSYAFQKKSNENPVYDYGPCNDNIPTLLKLLFSSSPIGSNTSCHGLRQQKVASVIVWQPLPSKPLIGAWILDPLV